MAKLQGGTTVYGSLSTSGVIYASGGNTSQWNNVYTSVTTSSATWNNSLPLSGGVLSGGLTGTSGIFTTSLSAPALSGVHYGDGSGLTGVVASGGTAIDTSKLPLSGGTLTGDLTGTVGVFTTSLSSPVYYGDGSKLSGLTSGLTSVQQDTNPTLGGNLISNSFKIYGGDNNGNQLDLSSGLNLNSLRDQEVRINVGDNGVVSKYWKFSNYGNGAIEVPSGSLIYGGNYNGNQIQFSYGLELKSLRNENVYIQTGLSGTSDKTWIYANDGSFTLPIGGSLSGATAKFDTSVFAPTLSSNYLYGDGSNLTNVKDNSKLPLSGGVLSDGLTAVNGLFTASLSSVSISGTYYGDGTNLTGVIHNSDSRLSDSRTPTGSAGGDLNGTYPNPTVSKIQGNLISTSTPSNGQMLQWSGSAWTPASIPTGGSGGGGVSYYMNYGTFAQSPISGLPSNSNTRQLGRTALVPLTSINSQTLSTTNYILVAGFVTDVLDPQITTIPAGLWDFNVWASGTASQANQTILKIVVYTYNGSTVTSLASSDDISMYDPTVTAQYIGNVTIPETTILSSTRIYVELKAKATSSNRTVTYYFGGNTPSHVHTTIPSVAGTGLVKTINSIFQTPASLLVDSDVDSNAQISQSKISGLTSALTGKFSKTDVIPISSGGTGATTAAAGLAALGGFPITGGTLSDGLTASSGTFTTSVSSPSISGVFYGDGSRLTGISTSLSASINYIIDGGGSIITMGSKGFILIPTNFTVQQWYVTSDANTTTVLDVRRAPYTSMPATSSVVSSDPPTISSSTKNRNTNVTLWSGLSAGDYLEFYVSSNTASTLMTVTLVGLKS